MSKTRARQRVGERLGAAVDRVLKARQPLVEIVVTSVAFEETRLSKLST